MPQSKGLTLEQALALGGKAGQPPQPATSGLTLEQAMALGGKPPEDLTAIRAQQAAEYPTQEPQTDPGTLGTIANSPAAGFLAGLGKGATGTALGISKLLGMVPSETTLNDLALPFSGGKKVIGEPEGTAQKLGSAVERAGEFMAGGEAVAPLKEAALAKTASPLLKAAITATAEGGAAGGVSAAQQGNTDNVLRTAATAGALSVALPAILQGARKYGMKIEDVAVKPKLADLQDGFKTENIFKYDLGGSLEQTLAKTQDKIDNLSAIAKNMRSGTPGLSPAGQIVGPSVNLIDMLGQAAKDLQTQAPRNQGGNEQIINALQKEFRELNILAQNGQIAMNGDAPIDVAHQILQGVGERGAWSYGFKDSDSIASEKVANAFYSKLRQGIESAIPNGSALKEVNKQISDLIPIKLAIIRRIPVAARNEVLSLPEIVSLASGSIPLSMFSRVAKNPRMANFLVGLGNNGGPIGSFGARVGAAAINGLSGGGPQ